MIKIRIENVEQKKTDYINSVLPTVVSKLAILHESLARLKGDILIDASEHNLGSLKSVTQKIAKAVGDDQLDGMANEWAGYTGSIAAYIAGPNNLANIDINELLQMCIDLSANDNEELKNLLTCPANDLLNKHEKIKNDYHINTAAKLKIIRLCFDYDGFREISRAIRGFFAANKFVEFCPYCNIQRAYHSTNLNGETVETFELDHFYDKSNYPFLAYSFFNLVPSDHTCNSTNKHDSIFNEQYHLNPHASGFDSKILFVPIGWTTNQRVQAISLSIIVDRHNAIYQKINGDNDPDLEAGELGNLNVFKIRSKHFREIQKASSLMRELHKINRGGKHLKRYIQQLFGFDIRSNYISWYEDRFEVKFLPDYFNDAAYSKFFRDLHDYYYVTNPSALNGYIRELIEANQAD